MLIKNVKMANNAAIRHGRYIMLVDSNKNDLFYMASLLGNLKYSICTAYTGVEAIVMADIVLPGLIIVDMELSDMSGTNFVQQIKRHKYACSVPIIMKSPLPSPESKNLSESIGCAGYLSNPSQVEILYSTIQAVMERDPRKNIRINVQIGVSVMSKSQGRLTGIYCSFFSKQGMYIKTISPCLKDEIIHVDFVLDGKQNSTDAIVLYSHKLQSDSYNDPGMGIKFINVSQECNDTICQYIHNHIMEGVELRGRTI